MILSPKMMCLIVLYRVRGWTALQIAAELNLPLDVVRAYINQLPSQELHEVGR